MRDAFAAADRDRGGDQRRIFERVERQTERRRRRQRLDPRFDQVGCVSS
jgi:hypothetical protein